MFGESFVMWGFIPEITRNCINMTNAESSYLVLIIGAILDSILVGRYIIDKRKYQINKMTSLIL
ncbi:MAG TPA: hypothetical protein VIQ04_04415 [Nitrososphaeraceae archaeon]|jgi:hypothetical protein